MLLVGNRPQGLDVQAGGRGKVQLGQAERDMRTEGGSAAALLLFLQPVRRRKTAGEVHGETGADYQILGGFDLWQKIQGRVW